MPHLDEPLVPQFEPSKQHVGPPQAAAAGRIRQLIVSRIPSQEVPVVAASTELSGRFTHHPGCPRPLSILRGCSRS